MSESFNNEPKGWMPDRGQEEERMHDGWKKESDNDQQRHYWIKQLESLTPLELPTDWPRSQSLPGQSANLAINLAETQITSLRELCNLESTTLCTGLLALTAILLHHHCSQDDLAIAVPTTRSAQSFRRQACELEHNNALPIRIRFTPTLSFRQLVGQIRDTIEQAEAQPRLSLAQIAEDLKHANNSGQTSLARVIVDANELRPAEQAWAAAVTSCDASEQRAGSIAELSFQFRHLNDGGIRLNLIYAQNLFKADRIQRLAAQFDSLLHATQTEPDAPAGSQSLISASERLVIESWQQGACLQLPEQCVHQLFEQQSEQTPSAVAVRLGDAQLTYAELNARANQLATHLIAHGVQPEVVVGVCLERSLELVITLLAILKAGGAYLPLGTKTTDFYRRTILNQSEAKLVITSSRQTDWQPDIDKLLFIEDIDWQAASNHEIANPDAKVNHRNAVYVIYTSGSTGQPKGVVNEHRGLLNRLMWMQATFQVSTNDRFLQKTPFTFDVSAWEFFLPLISGATLILARPDGEKDPHYLAAIIQAEAITISHFVPSMLELFLDAQGVEACRSLRLVLCSGETMPSTLPTRLNSKLPDSRLFNCYGPTEASIEVCEWESIGKAAMTSVPIGRPAANTKLMVVDSQGQPTPILVHGELWIGGLQVARGYINDPKRTAERFIADPSSTDSCSSIYKTGDIASWNADGTLAFHGRLDHQIKLRGFRIEPGEIEASLLSHPLVAQVVVVLRHDDPMNPRLVAYWVRGRNGRHPHAGGNDLPAGEELRKHVIERLPAYMVPSAMVELEALPLSSSGKLDRSKLPAPSFTTDQNQRRHPSTELERQIHGLWAEVLGHKDFGITDNFFLVGGHSLAAARLIARLEQRFGQAPSLDYLFQQPTIDGLQTMLATSPKPSRQPGLELTIPTVAALGGAWHSGCQAYPASHAQRGLWFLQQLQPGLTAYHIPTLWQLQGILDLDALSHALSELIRRHPTLRTSFQLHGAEVVQILHPPAPIQLEVEVLGGRQPASVIEHWLHQEGSTPFDLSAGILLRARLLQVANDQHILLLNQHHIASDGWSRYVLTRDLSALYNARHNRRSADLPSLPILYHDYAAWQRAKLHGERLQTLHHYWTRQLSGLEPLELPTDRPRPATPTTKGDSIGFSIESGLFAAFEELCRLEGATVQMGLLALLALLLHRYSRQEDFAIGIPMWGRNHPDLENLIGCFVNTLPIRTRWSGDGSFRQHLAQIRATAIEAYEHQDLPFALMVEALQPERATSHHPLVQVMLQLVELPEHTPTDLQGLEVEPLSAKDWAARFDLEFVFERQPMGGLNAAITYCTDLFSADRIERLASHLVTLLTSVLQAPDTAAATLTILPEGERRRIESWQNGPSIALPDCGVHQQFEQQAARTPEAVALIMADQQLSYRELNGRADALARQLIDLGVKPEAILGVCMQRSPELIIALLAILKAGCAYLPLDPDWPPERRRALLHQSGAGLVLTQEGTQVIRAMDSGSPAPLASCLATIYTTSGSTGTAKSVAISHRAILRLVDPVNGFRLGPGSVVLHLAPVAFDAASFEIWGPLLNGGTVVLAPAQPPSLAELAACLRRHHITTLWLTAGLFHAMVDRELDALAGVQQVLAGGDVLHPASVHRLLTAFPEGHELINGYGPTENATFTCCQVFKAGDRWKQADVPIGRPIAMTSVHLLDPSGQPCPIGIPGELHIGGDGLAWGYLNHPELTREKFIQDPFTNDPAARLYRSGDLACWNPDGSLNFLGRIDRQIKLRGFRIEPGEIETNLLAHPDVVQVVVLLNSDDPANPRLIAYWVPSSHRGCQEPIATPTPTAMELRSFLAARLPDPMLPSAFVALDSLPLTTNGKLDRQALPAPSFAGDRGNRLAPSTQLEQQLHSIWTEVLGHADFGITDNFFAIGGHSLAAARLIARLEQALLTRVSLTTLFQNPTIAALTTVLAARTATTGTGSVPPSVASIPRAQALANCNSPGCLAFPASYAQTRLWFLHQLQPDLIAYHLPMLWRLRGGIDLEALEQALTALIDRHPTLRTSFQRQEDELLQIIHPASNFSLIPELGPDRDSKRFITEWINREVSTPFDLQSGQLIRVRLLQLGDDEHLLLINHHHIASDGWSCTLLANDLGELYNAIRARRPAALQPLLTQYQDYAFWQRQNLRGKHLEALLDYWIPQLTGIEPLALPADHSRPTIPSHRGHHVDFQIDSPLLKRFEALCERHSATLQMGLLAAVAALLHRYSRQQDFAIGVPMWGRTHPSLESLIGFFINTLPIRTRIEPGKSFRDLLIQVRDTSLAAYEHQDLPFEQMVESLQSARDTSRNPLVQVMLQLIEIPLANLDNLDGIETETLMLDVTSSKLDLSFYLHRHQDQGLRGSIGYATDLFEADRIQRLSLHLQMLISSAVQSPDTSIGKLKILPDEEQKRIESWQKGPTINIPALGVHQLFERQAMRKPAATALVFEDSEISYEQLNRRSNQLANYLRDHGITPGAVVGVSLTRSPEVIIAILGILKAGGIYMTLESDWPLNRKRIAIASTHCRAVIDDSKTVGGALASGDIELIDLNTEDINQEPDSTPAPIGTCTDHVAYIIFTSGSTGIPKGIEMTHRALTLKCLSTCRAWDLQEKTSVLALSSFGFDISFRETIFPLTQGCVSVLANETERKSPASLAKLASRNGVTRIQATPSHWQELMRHGLHAIRPGRLISIGERLPKALAQALCRERGNSLLHLYGTTEAPGSSAAIYTHPQQIEKVSIGEPLHNTVLRILDNNLQPCPIGIPGELHIGGDGLAQGYLGHPQLSAERFIQDPFSSAASDHLYKSGDLASWNADGTIVLHGRIDTQINLRGFRIEPGDIENQLLEHPAVTRAVVMLHADSNGHSQLVAYWVAAASDPNHTISEPGYPTADELRTFLSERLPTSMLPAVFMKLDSIPLTSNGKLDHHALPSPHFHGDLEQRVEPTTALQIQLHDLWAEVLRHTSFGINDNFFLVGGHSLAAVQLVDAIEHRFSQHWPVADVFRCPTIAAQVKRIRPMLGQATPAMDGLTGQRPSCLVTLQPDGKRPPLFVLHDNGGTLFTFVDLAASLAPHRPVYGLQANLRLLGAHSHTSVRQLAESHADEILQKRPNAPIHLLGFSAGGWYAHAVAEALLARGAQLGLFIVLDSAISAKVHRRIGLQVMLLRIVLRIGPTLHRLLQPPQGMRHLDYLIYRLRALADHLDRALQLHSVLQSFAFRPLPKTSCPRPTSSAGQTLGSRLRRDYRPNPLAIQVHLFAPAWHLPVLRLLWRFYCRSGVISHPLFEEHIDFFRPDLMPQLAAALEEILPASDSAVR